MVDFTEYDKVLARAKALGVKKNHDYGDEPLKAFGDLGVIMRLHDKVSRLRTLVYNSEMAKVDEKIEDTALDIINYAAYLVMMRERKL
jgi:hypothetical protein